MGSELGRASESLVKTKVGKDDIVKRGGGGKERRWEKRKERNLPGIPGRESGTGLH